MKKVLFALAVMCVGCQQTPQDKVRVLVEGYFMENANDPDALEIVSVSDVQPDSVYIYSEEYKYKIDTMEIQHYIDMTYLAMEADDLDKADEYVRKVDSLNADMKAKMDSFEPYQRGMKADVKVRDRNENGAKVLKEVRVYFDNELTKVTGTDE